MTEHIKLNGPFFWEILKAVCLGFVHLPMIGPIPFQIIEQKFVQQSETQMDADACKSSYILYLSIKLHIMMNMFQSSLLIEMF